MVGKLCGIFHVGHDQPSLAWQHAWRCQPTFPNSALVPEQNLLTNYSLSLLYLSWRPLEHWYKVLPLFYLTLNLQPVPKPCPMPPFHLFVLELYSFILKSWKSGKQNGPLNSVSCSSKLIKPKGEFWKSPIYRWLVRGMEENLDMQLVSEAQGWGVSHLGGLSPWSMGSDTVSFSFTLHLFSFWYCHSDDVCFRCCPKRPLRLYLYILPPLFRLGKFSWIVFKFADSILWSPC